MFRRLAASLLMLLAACSSARQDTSVVPDDEVVVLKEARFESVEGREVRLSQGIYRVARTGDATLSVSGRAGKHALKAMPANVEGTIEGNRAILLTMPDQPPRLVWASKKGCLEAVPKSGAVRSRALLSQPIQLAPASLTVLDPSATSLWCAGSRHNILWRKLGTQNQQVQIILYQNLRGLLSYHSAVSIAPNTGTYLWSVPRNLDGSYVIYIQTVDGLVRDYSSPFTVAPARFRGIGFLYSLVTPGSHANAVSADGSVVVGQSWNGSSLEAIRWTSAGMAGLGDIRKRPQFVNEAFGVSGDGSVVAGCCFPLEPDPTPQEAFRWSATTGMTGLGTYGDRVSEPGRFLSTAWQAKAVSADGSTIVGFGPGPGGTGQEAFRWRAGTITGPQGIGDLPGGPFNSAAYAVSADGSTIVGVGYPDRGTEAFIWTAGSGMRGIGFLTSDSPSSIARGVSGDGSVVVGESFTSLGYEAFRWSGGSMFRLGSVKGGGVICSVVGVSADGSVIAGNQAGYAPAIWDAGHGPRALTGLVADCGGNMTGWTYLEARAISADGRTIVGRGRNPKSQWEGWIVTFPVSPAVVP